MRIEVCQVAFRKSLILKVYAQAFPIVAAIYFTDLQVPEKPPSSKL